MQREAYFPLLAAFALVICGAAGRELDDVHQAPVHRDPKFTFVNISGEWFLLGNDKFETWYDAEIKCQDFGRQLVTLDTQERWTMISDWMMAHPDYNFWYWTSGYKKASDQDFVWTTTGEVFNFTDWRRGEPDRGVNAESCMSFWASLGGWDDDGCISTPLWYMCENIPKSQLQRANN